MYCTITGYFDSLLNFFLFTGLDICSEEPEEEDDEDHYEDHDEF